MGSSQPQEAHQGTFPSTRRHWTEHSAIQPRVFACCQPVAHFPGAFHHRLDLSGKCSRLNANGSTLEQTSKPTLDYRNKISTELQWQITTLNSNLHRNVHPINPGLDFWLNCKVFLFGLQLLPWKVILIQSCIHTYISRVPPSCPICVSLC